MTGINKLFSSTTVVGSVKFEKKNVVLHYAVCPNNKDSVKNLDYYCKKNKKNKNKE